MGKFRDGMPVTAEAVTLILSSIDRIKEILGGLEATEAEPEGNDQDLIVQLHQLVERDMEAMSTPAAIEPVAPAPPPAKPSVQGTLAFQVLERELRPGEVSLDELERAFRETAPEIAPPQAPVKASAPEPKVSAPPVAEVEPEPRAASPKGSKPAAKKTCRSGSRRRRSRRQPVDPGECRHARTPDDDGVGAGADAQPAAGDLAAQRGYRIQGAAAAAVQRHRRTAGRRHEDADAADRQCLAEAAAHRARPLQRTRTSRSNWRCTAPTPSSTARCST